MSERGALGGFGRGAEREMRKAQRDGCRPRGKVEPSAMQVSAALQPLLHIPVTSPCPCPTLSHPILPPGPGTKEAPPYMWQTAIPCCLTNASTPTATPALRSPIAPEWAHLPPGPPHTHLGRPERLVQHDARMRQRLALTLVPRAQQQGGHGGGLAHTHGADGAADVLQHGEAVADSEDEYGEDGEYVMGG